VNVNPSPHLDAAFGRVRLASPRIGLVLTIATALSMLMAVPFVFVDGFGLWVPLIPFGIVGAIVARRQPWNPVGTILLFLTFAVVASADAGEYAVQHYRRGYHGLPLAQVAAFLAAGQWIWLVALLPLPIALFPDGRLSSRWRWVLRAHLAFIAFFLAGNAWDNANGVLARHVKVDSSGQLASNGSGGGNSAGNVVLILFYLAFLAAWTLRLVLSYRRASGDYRQQLKWLVSGAALGFCGILLAVSVPANSSIDNALGGLGFLTALLALPIGLGVSILKYRLYEIDRLISRTLSYAIITALLVGVFIGIVVLATDVLPFSSPVAVAASTLAAAALFNPLRLRIQRLVDRRFNRARYDAEAIVGAFTLRLRDAVDLDTVRGELLQAVTRAVQPAHASVWIRPPR
jgi:hypothetical protein